MDHSIIIQKIRPLPDAIFIVTIQGEKTRTRHTVTLSQDYYNEIGGKEVALEEDVIKWSFEFLLSKEPQEEIFEQFQVANLKNYFPEFESFVKSKQGK